MSNVRNLHARRRQVEALKNRLDALARSKSITASTEGGEITREQALDLLRQLAKGTGENAARARALLGELGASAQDNATAESLRARMGLPTHDPRIRAEGTSVVFGVMTSQQAREHRAARHAARTQKDRQGA